MLIRLRFLPVQSPVGAARFETDTPPGKVCLNS